MATVVIVIDMQEDFFANAVLAGKRDRLCKQINGLTREARANGLPVVWVRQEFSPGLSDASGEVRRKRIRITIAGTPGAALLHELQVAAGDIQLVKTRYSAFFGTGLDALLESLACECLVVAGINSHACIRTTVVDAYQRDLQVVLATDCIDSHDEAHGEVSMRYMDGKLATGLAGSELLARLAGDARA